MQPLTDEERQKLCANLRRWHGDWGTPFLRQAAEEIERLGRECDDLIEQLAIRSESGMARDMQKIMQINNELLEENRQLKDELDLVRRDEERFIYD